MYRYDDATTYCQQYVTQTDDKSNIMINTLAHNTVYQLADINFIKLGVERRERNMETRGDDTE